MDLIEMTSHNSFRHPWELSRQVSISSLVYLKAIDEVPLTIADIGAGDLFFLQTLISDNSFVTLKCLAVDTHYHDDQTSDLIHIIKILKNYLMT